jgi:hypothetical protein
VESLLDNMKHTVWTEESRMMYQQGAELSIWGHISSPVVFKKKKKKKKKKREEEDTTAFFPFFLYKIHHAEFMVSILESYKSNKLYT